MRLFFLLFLLLGVASAAMAADTIVVEGGDSVTGSLKRLDGGWIRFETDYARPLDIRKDQVREITTEEDVSLRIETGEVIKGRLRTDDEGRLWVERFAGARPVFIDWNRVEAINPPPVKWSGNLVVGGRRESGNTERQSASVSLDAKRRTQKERFSLALQVNYGEEDDEVTTRNTYGSLKYDYFFTERFYGFLSLEALYDKFRDLNLRTVAGPGLGYQVWDDDRKSLSLELGVAYQNEDYIEGEDDYWFTGRAAADFSYRLVDGITFRDQVIYYSRLEDTSDYQLRNEASLSSQLLTNWSLKLSHILQYDSKPQAGVDKRDDTWILGLQYSF